jgi:hypothetical protein
MRKRFDSAFKVRFHIGAKQFLRGWLRSIANRGENKEKYLVF